MEKPNTCRLLEVDRVHFLARRYRLIQSVPSLLRPFLREPSPPKHKPPKGGHCIIVIVKVFNDVLAYRTPNDARCLVLAFGVALSKRECPALRIVEASDFARPNPNRVQVDFAPFD